MFPHRDSPLIGRDLEISIAERAVLDAASILGHTFSVTAIDNAGNESTRSTIVNSNTPACAAGASRGT